MIKPNWDMFKAKFSENPQDNFEWFCYLLFCKEFNKPMGVSGYKNHRHIEHDPIEEGKEVIGWQAKFYETKLTDHKSEIIKFIKRSKEDYPNITKIIFYTNKNWSQGTIENDPKAKIDIDNEATKLGVEIDWKHMANFFESPFVSISNADIAKHFFELDINLDPRDIAEYLKELPLVAGENETGVKINEWYQQKEISLEEKELLFIIISNIFNHNQSLTQEINNLRSKGKPEIAEYLESIQKDYAEGNANKIKEAYFSRKEKLKQENILILKESIKATENLFAIEEAKNLYQELIELERSADNYSNFAHLLHRFNYFDDATNYYQKALEINEKLAKENPDTYSPIVAETLSDFANLHSSKNEFPQALEKYAKALVIFKKLSEENPDTYFPKLVIILNNQAILYSHDKANFPKAYSKYNEIISIFDRLKKGNVHLDLALLATVLNNLANLQKDNFDFPQVLNNYNTALKIRKDLAAIDADTYLPDVATTLHNLANLQVDCGEFPQALFNYEEALKIRRKFAEENPRTYTPMVASTLNNLANYYSKTKDFPKAYEIYGEILMIRKELAKEDSNVYLPLVAGTLGNLALTQMLDKKYSLALINYEESLTINEKLAKENPKAYLIDVAVLLTNIEGVYIRMNNHKQALVKYEEALVFYIELFKNDPSIYGFKYAEILVYGVNNYKKDKKDLLKAMGILEEYPNTLEKQKLLKWISELEQVATPL